MTAAHVPWTCPRDHTPLDRALRCPTCGTQHDTVRDVPNLLHPPLPEGTFAQAAMRSRLVARVYEHIWRPAWSRLGGTLDLDAEEAFLRAALPEGAQTAVDVATGTGRYARILASALPGPIVAVDASPAMLEQARATLPANVAVVRARADHLPLPDGWADVITCFGALHLMDDHPLILADLARVLRPGGALVLQSIVLHTLGAIQPCQARLAAATGIGAPDPVALRDQLEAVGLHPKAWQHSGALLLLSARKP